MSEEADRRPEGRAAAKEAMVDRAEFVRLAETFGGDLTRWPSAAANGARALLADDSDAASAEEARLLDILAEEAALDALLAQTPPPPAPRSEMFAEMEAGFRAVATQRQEGQALVAALEAQRTTEPQRGFWACFLTRLTRALGDAADAIGGRGAFAGGIATAAAAGLIVGMVGFTSTTDMTQPETTTTAESEELLLNEDDESFAVADVEGWFVAADTLAGEI